MTWLSQNLAKQGTGNWMIENSGIIGAGIINRAITTTLYVSPNGDNSDGSSWINAYNTIQGALDAASTDVNDCTLIMIGVNTGTNYYDINTTGDPTYTGNYILKGTHRTWAKIKNTHASATSLFKFTGYVSMMNLNFNLGTSNNGVQMVKSAARVSYCQFVGEDLTSAKTALELGDGGATTARWGKIDDCYFLGEGLTHMTALKLNNTKYTFILNYEVAACKIGLHIVHADTDVNVVNGAGIDVCATGIQIDAGNAQYFQNIRFDGNTTNITDSVGDSLWCNMCGTFPIALTNGLTGQQVDTHANAATYGADTELRSAVAATKPFKIVGYYVDPNAAEKFKVRFSGDSGSSFFSELLTETTMNQAASAAKGTDYIFNKGTRISASAQCETGGKNIKVWLEIQEI